MFVATKMAMIGSRLNQHNYPRSEQELQDHILDIYGTKENDADLFRPSLADQHKVGFFTLDRCSQTDVSEVVDLKEMTDVIQVLLQDVTTLRRDINLKRHVMQADYESKLQEKAIELYVRINEKVSELERLHQDRVTTVRRAFRQQLSDAIARVAVLYNKNLERKIKREKKKQEEGQGKHDEKYKEMQATIQRNETVIQMLKMQLAQYQQQTVEADSPEVTSSRPSNTTPASPVSPHKKHGKSSVEEKSQSATPTAPPPKAKTPTPSPPPPPKKAPPPPPPQPAKLPPVPAIKAPVDLKHRSTQTEDIKLVQEVVEDVSIKSRSPSINEEFEALKEECDGLTRKVDRLEEALEIKEDENASLVQEMNQLNEQLQKETIMVDQLKHEAQELKSLAEKDKESSKLLAESLSSDMEKQKANMQKMMDEKLRQAKEEILQQAQSEAKSLQDAEQNKIKLLMDQKKLLEQQLQQDIYEDYQRERKKSTQKTQEEVDTEKYKRQEQKLKDEIERLKREIERVHRTWEKKFAILQQSLHALKDESYIRQTLQRQAAALHHAAVSYAVDTPVGIMPTQKHSSSMKKPVVPDIPKNKPAPSGPGQPLNPGGGVLGEKDYISYTVSAPSGRGTAMLSVDENQVMSDGEQQDIPDDVQHIPPPPARQTESEGDVGGGDSQLSSRSHVVVMPTVQGQT